MRHPVTPYSRNTPQSFSQEPGYIFSRDRQSMCYVFGMLPGFVEKLLGSGNLFCSVTAATKTGGYHPALVPLFSRHLGIHRPWKAKQRDALVVGSLTPVSIFVYGDDQFANRSVSFQNAMPLDTHESAKPSGVLSSRNSLSNFAIGFKLDYTGCP